MKFKQLVLAINGMARSGKDSFAEFSIEQLTSMENFSDVSGSNISSVDKVKELFTLMGWNGEKDDKSRKGLSDLKDLWTEYNDGPFREILKYVMDSPSSIIFVHIREPKEIDKLKYWCLDNSIFFESIHVKRDEVKVVNNNTGDNGSLEKYDYTNSFTNNGSLDQWKEFAKTCVIDWVKQYRLDK